MAAGAYFDASIVLALLALAIAGPLPALLVWIVPDAISRLVIRQDPVLTPGLVATVSSFALAVLVGYGVLQLAGAPSMVAATPALYTTGLLIYAVNFLFARLTFAPFYQGYRPSVLIQTEFREMMPPFAAMLALGVATAVLVEPLGVFALAPLALVVVVPQLALAQLGRDRSVTRLSRPEATTVYAAAIADVLDLPRRERRTIADAAALLDRAKPRGARSRQVASRASARRGPGGLPRPRAVGRDGIAGGPSRRLDAARQPRARRRAGLERADRGRHAGAVALRGDAGPVPPCR